MQSTRRRPTGGHWKGPKNSLTHIKKYALNDSTKTNRFASFTMRVKKTAASQAAELGGGGSMILLNFSGHPAPRGIEGLCVVEVEIPSVTPTPPGVTGAARQMFDEAGSRPEVAEAVSRGEYQMMLPGYAPLAAALITESAGRTGRLPTVRWTVRRRSKYICTPPVDLQAARTAARGRRKM